MPCVVVGGSHGIGLAPVTALLEEGAVVLSTGIELAVDGGLAQQLTPPV